MKSTNNNKSTASFGVESKSFINIIVNPHAHDFIDIIQAMYRNVYYCVKLPHGITPSFESTVGVKQGCVLSPILFNLFLSDLPDIFTHECDPVSLGNRFVSCLMFADDLVILSETPAGLQSALSKLQKYTED